jgi:hypothetical protein
MGRFAYFTFVSVALILSACFSSGPPVREAPRPDPLRSPTLTRQERFGDLEVVATLELETLAVTVRVPKFCRTVTTLPHVRDARTAGGPPSPSGDHPLLVAGAAVLHAAAREPSEPYYSRLKPPKRGARTPPPSVTADHGPMIQDGAANDLVQISEWEACGAGDASEREVAVKLANGEQLTAVTDDDGSARVDLAAIAPDLELVRSPTASVHIGGRPTTTVDLRGSRVLERWRGGLATESKDAEADSSAQGPWF